MLVLVCLVVAIVLGPLVVNIDPMQTNPQRQFRPPDAANVLGTDLLGRDVLSRTLYGGRRSLLIAALATGASVLPGLVIGFFSADEHFLPSRFLRLVMNAFLAIPGLIIALVVVTLLGQNLTSLILAVGVAQIAPFAFVTRAAVLSVRSEDYIEAALSLGATRWHVIIYHVLPAIQPVALAYLGVVFSYTLLNSAALSFLGLGGEPGVPDWGVMLAEGRSAFRIAPWVAFAPGLAIALTVWSVNCLVDQAQSIRNFGV